MSTWILLRGLTREAGHWGAFPEQLALALPGARALPLDLPGNGALHARPSPFRIPEMAAACRAELVRLGVRPPYHLLGMSMGGMVATAWSEAHPEEIRACALINTSFGAFSPVGDRLRPGAWPVLLALLFTPTAQGREGLIFDLTSRLQEGARPRVIQEWVALRGARPVRLGNALRQLIASARYRAPQAAPVPMLVLSGARDRLVHPRCSQEIAHRWACAQAVHPGAGHDLTLDDGPWVADALRKWLQGGPEPRAPDGASCP